MTLVAAPEMLFNPDFEEGFRFPEEDMSPTSGFDVSTLAALFRETNVTYDAVRLQQVAASVALRRELEEAKANEQLTEEFAKQHPNTHVKIGAWLMERELNPFQKRKTREKRHR